MEFIFFVLLVLMVFFVWLYPIVRIARSPRTQGVEKIAWVMITAFLFWFAWVIYLFVAPIDTNKK